jgi:transcriptional regulator NrdR family protein
VKRFGHEFTQRERECRACKTRFITEERVVRD